MIRLLVAAATAGDAVSGVTACSEPFYSTFLSVCGGTYPSGGDCGTDSSVFTGFNCSVAWTTPREFRADCAFAHGSCAFSVAPAGDVNRCTERCIRSAPILAAAVGAALLLAGAVALALLATKCCWRRTRPRDRELSTQDGSFLHASLTLEGAAQRDG
jgi:hypothetical protein